MRVMILAAGRGNRMRPLTDTTPKPLLRAGGKALIEHHLLRLQSAGFNDIVINLAHLGQQIERALGDGGQYGLRIRYSKEGEVGLETGGGIRHALPLLGPGPFMVVNGDVYTEFPFQQLSERSLAAEDLAHLVMVPNPPQHPAGDFALDEGRLLAQGAPTYTFSGIGIYRAELLATTEAPVFPLAPLLIKAMQAGRVSGELYSGEWRDIGTPERLAALDRDLGA